MVVTPIPIQLSASCWLDAADTRTITSSGGLVSVWQDKSGKGNNATQATGADQPTTGSQTLNGLNVISVSSVATIFFSLPAMLPNLSVANSATHVFMVGSSTTIGRNIFNTDTTNRFVTIYATSGTQLRAGFGTANTNVGSGAPPPIPFVIDTYYSKAAGVGSMIVNGAAPLNTTAVSFTAAPTTLTLGNGMNGYLAEFIVFNYALSTSQIAQVFNYLNRKWAIY